MTKRSLTLVPFVLLAFVLSLAAQQQHVPAAPSQGTTSPDTTSKDAPSPDTSSKDTLSAKKRKKLQEEEAALFDERIAAEVLGTIRDGLEGHSQRLLLSAFDGNKMNDFLTFQDQIEAYFTRYEGFRVTLRIIQTSEENDHGVILAAFQLENEPRGGGRISRREGQLRFELERGAKGWKIVDFTPRGFFS